MKRGTFEISEAVIVNYCRGEYDGERALRVEAAIASSVELQELVRKVQMVVALEQDIEEVRNTNVKAAFAQIEKRITPHYTGVQIWAGYVNRYAAVLLMPFIITSLVFAILYFQHPVDSVTYTEVNTPLGSTMRYELPDGSVVWLNAGSKLRFPNRFSEHVREVELWGEGFFEVKADLQHPFYVITENGTRVFAYGTRFNVNSYADEDYVEAVLEKGRVNVISPDGNTSVVLQPGERGVLSKIDHSLKVEETGLYEKTAWREGKMVFRNAPLEVILKRLSRHYNVDIVMKNQSDKKYFYRATFNNESIFQILDYLKMSAPLEWGFVESVQNSDSTFTKRLIEVRMVE